MSLLRSEGDRQNAQAAFAIAAMRSRVTAHVFLRGDAILASNKLFLDLVRSAGGPWTTSGDGAWPDLREVVRAQCARLARHAAVARYERSDSAFVVEVRTEPIGDPSTRLTVATLLDLTSVVRATAESARAAAKLEALQEANERKDEFLRMLSHELRNPLAPITSSVHILQRSESLSDGGRHALTVLERQVRHLTRLVDELLDVSRIERGKITLQPARVDLRDVVRRAAADFRSVIVGRGLALRTSFPEAALPADVDATRITQLIGNLVQNAVKFTDAGGEVTISLAASRDAAELRVSDTGEGIEAAVLPHVFDVFAQGPRTLARTEGGLGLGLAMVKGIAELHGGTVRAESPGIGKGTHVIVRLPLAPGAALGARHVPGASTARPARAKRVLVVDDNEDAAEAMAEMLRLQGHVVDVAYDGPTAIVKTSEGRPDAVLCDIGLPGMTGYELARALRAGGCAGLKLIAVSGYAQASDVQRALDAGFDAHVAKPCELDAIERLLG